MCAVMMQYDRAVTACFSSSLTSNEKGGECEECQSRELLLQRQPAAAASVAHEAPAVPASVHDVLNSPGQPLDSQTRDFIEPRFGQDLGHVRVHTGRQAAESAR